MGLPAGEIFALKQRVGSAVAEDAGHAAAEIEVVPKGDCARQPREHPQLVLDAVANAKAGREVEAALVDDVAHDGRLEVVGPAGVGIVVLGGHPEIDAGHATAACAANGIVQHIRIAAGEQTDAGVPRFGHQAVADDPADVLVVFGVHHGVEELGAGVEAEHEPQVAAAFGGDALHHGVQRAPLHIGAGGGGVVDVAVGDVHAVGVDRIDAFGVLLVGGCARCVAHARVVDFAAPDGHIVTAGGHLDHIAARVVQRAVFDQHIVGGEVVERAVIVVPLRPEKDGIEPAGNLQAAQGDALGLGVDLHTEDGFVLVDGHRAGDVGLLAFGGLQGQVAVPDPHGLVVLTRVQQQAVAGSRHVVEHELDVAVGSGSAAIARVVVAIHRNVDALAQRGGGGRERLIGHGGVHLAATATGATPATGAASATFTARSGVGGAAVARIAPCHRQHTGHAANQSQRRRHMARFMSGPLGGRWWIPRDGCYAKNRGNDRKF